jgi:hypothetical protein
MGRFFKAFAHFFTSHFGQAPSVLQKARSILDFIGPLVKRIFAQLDPGDAALAGTVIQEVQTSLGSAAGFIADAHNSTDKTANEKVVTGINAVANHLNDLLAAGHIKDAGLKADVTLGLEELQAVVKQLSA